MPPSGPSQLELSHRSALESLLQDREDAQRARERGYLARVMVQATMPHSDPKTDRFERTNGYLTVRIVAHGEGLPYGSVPRLLLAWVTTEAVRTRSRDLVLGQTLSSFMEQLDLVPTGGRYGTIPRLRRQMERLFSSAVSCSYQGEDHKGGGLLAIAREWELWWDPKRPRQAALWQSTVRLSADFFAEIIDRPVPIDLAALKALKRSPLALDVYAWLTYRSSYLRRAAIVPWEALALQFGGDYARIIDFRVKFTRALQKVVTVYPEARVQVERAGLMLRPSPTSISPRLR